MQRPRCLYRALKGVQMRGTLIAGAVIATFVGVVGDILLLQATFTTQAESGQFTESIVGGIMVLLSMFVYLLVIYLAFADSRRSQ